MRTLLPEEMKTRREDGNDDEHQEKKGTHPLIFLCSCSPQ